MPSVHPIRTDHEGRFPVFKIVDLPAALSEIGVPDDQIKRVMREIMVKRSRYAEEGKTNFADFAAVHDGWKPGSFMDEKAGNAMTVVSAPHVNTVVDGELIDRSFYGELYHIVVRVIR